MSSPTQTGSYPRPHWNSFDLGAEDIRAAMRRADFAEAFADGVRFALPRQIARGKLAAMTTAAEQLRSEIGP
jgi:hypothetical protein